MSFDNDYDSEHRLFSFTTQNDFPNDDEIFQNFLYL
jgi:hypothetical protein